MHVSNKRALGYDAKTTESQITRDWKKRTRRLCKPCWELQYCPYGPLVEQFPLPPPTRDEAQEHNDYLRSCLDTGRFGENRKLDPARRRSFASEVAEFRASDYPTDIPDVLAEASCRVFGHVCPVFFVAEPLTETRHLRTHSRSIPRDVMLRVVRRDGQICQKCHKPVPDNEVEFDHLIPFSKGGRSVTENLRLVHRNCNRKKGSSLEELLHPYPMMHALEPRSRKRGGRSKARR